jgi:hypothetical protein
MDLQLQLTPQQLQKYFSDFVRSHMHGQRSYLPLSNLVTFAGGGASIAAGATVVVTVTLPYDIWVDTIEFPNIMNGLFGSFFIGGAQIIPSPGTFHTSSFSPDRARSFNACGGAGEIPFRLGLLKTSQALTFAYTNLLTVAETLAGAMLVGLIQSPDYRALANSIMIEDAGVGGAPCAKCGESNGGSGLLLTK